MRRKERVDPSRGWGIPDSPPFESAFPLGETASQPDLGSCDSALENKGWAEPPNMAFFRW